MAFIQGEVTGHNNVYAKLLDFLKNDPTLKAAGQAWEKIGDHKASDPNQVGEYLKGKGQGAQPVYCLVKKHLVAEKSCWNIQFRTFTGYNPTHADNPESQPGDMGEWSTISTNNRDPVNYLFIASGRRFTGFIQTLSNYQNFYVGLFIPYCEPQHYIYPCICAGQQKYWDSWLGYEHDTQRGFICATDNYLTSDMPSPQQKETGTVLHKPDGKPHRCAAMGKTDYVDRCVRIHPTENFGTAATAIKTNRRASPGGGPGGLEPLEPVILWKYTGGDVSGGGEIYGELDGVRAVSGLQQQTRKVITDSDNKKWLVSQSGHRTGGINHHVFRLE